MSTPSEDEAFSPSDWVSQAEAARIKGVTRQAIHKLVKGGRLASREVAGRILVRRADLSAVDGGPIGGPADGLSPRVRRMLDALDAEEKAALLRVLREDAAVHPLERSLGAKAEVILEAIERAGAITLRMFKGIMAEAAFKTYVVDRLSGWSSRPLTGNRPYDFELNDPEGPVRVQVKLQRSKDGIPWRSEDVPRRYQFGQGRFVVETRKTRAGQEAGTGKSTRPYRFGEFDILAVALYPATGRWDTFTYTVADWLLPQPDDPGLIEVYQPVSRGEDDDWTADFGACVERLRRNEARCIRRS